MTPTDPERGPTPHTRGCGELLIASLAAVALVVT